MARGFKYGGRTIAVLGVVLLMFVVYQLWGTSLQYARAQSELRDDFSSLLAQAAAFKDSSTNLDSSAGANLTSGDTVGIATLSNDTATLSAGTVTLSAGTDQLSTGTAQFRASGTAPVGTGTETGSAELEAAKAGSPETSSSGRSSQDSSQDTATSPPRASEEGATEVELRKTLLVSPSTRLPRAEIENADLVYTPGAKEILPLLYPGDSEAVARIIIPAIKIDEIVVAGTDVDALRKGPGHYSWTPLPGQPGNASIAGHRTTYGAPFANIGNLRPNDRITVQTAQGEFIYEVLSQDLPTKGYLIVSPDRVDLLHDKGNNLLTLTSCHPRFSNRQRIVVQAKLLGNPVVPMRDLNARQDAPQELVSEDLTKIEDEASATGEAKTGEISVISESGAAGNAAKDTPVGEVATGEEDIALQEGSASRPIVPSSPTRTVASRNSASGSQFSDADTEVGTNFGSGLNGERSAIPSAVLWFIATAILWATVWLIGTRWRRIPSVAIGILPVLGCLFVAFSYLDRALPSY